MMIQQREQQALEVYFKLLVAKGFDQTIFVQRTNFLNKLLPFLAHVEMGLAEYRLAIEAVMDSVPAEEWPENLMISREYFLFWMNDLKAVAQFNKATTKDSLPMDWKPAPINLRGLWQTIDQEKFTTSDSWAIKGYTKALRNENADQTLIDTRVKLAKILLVRLKDTPDKSNKVYRTTVDATLPLFEVKKNRRLFLVVVREFFHFWSGNPDAEKFVLNANTDSML